MAHSDSGHVIRRDGWNKMTTNYARRRINRLIPIVLPYIHDSHRIVHWICLYYVYNQPQLWHITPYSRRYIYASIHTQSLYLQYCSRDISYQNAIQTKSPLKLNTGRPKSGVVKHGQHGHGTHATIHLKYRQIFPHLTSPVPCRPSLIQRLTFYWPSEQVDTTDK